MQQDDSAATEGRILLVEDDGHSRRITNTALSASGFEVHEADTGEEGVEMARTLGPDLVVMDLGLPGMSGFEAIMRIKRESRPEPPLVIVLTARILKDDVEKARSAGCDSFLAKPIDPFDLVHEVKRLVDERRSRT
jgi:two-component system cell cycle response regulator DivK